jgi:hypothetical protein
MSERLDPRKHRSSIPDESALFEPEDRASDFDQRAVFDDRGTADRLTVDPGRIRGALVGDGELLLDVVVVDRTLFLGDGVVVSSISFFRLPGRPMVVTCW